MRKTWHEYFFDIAHMVAERSTCLRLHVGAVIVKDNRILATGYNGAPSKLPQCDEIGCLLEDERCHRTIHAEVNALLELSRIDLKGAQMYTTHYPCRNCAQLIANSGVAEIYYDLPYHRAEPIWLTHLKVVGRDSCTQ